MARPLGARQLAQIRREMESDLKRKDLHKLKALRESIREAKAARRGKLREVTTKCRSAVRENMARAKHARERLRASILRTREQAKGLCELSRGEAKADTLEAIERAVGTLEKERAEQRQLAAWVRPKVCPTRGRTAKEKRAESDCEVESNLDDPGLRVVWEAVKHRIKAGPRRTRTEAFLEWAAEHPSDVYQIQEADTERALDQLEKEERRMSKDVANADRYRKRSSKELAEMLDAVPF
jgi:hypothetical protein